MESLIIEKVDQATGILKEVEIDIWLTFVRETTAFADPVLPIIYGHDLTWQSAILLHKSGKHTIILGHFEAETAKNVGVFNQIVSYHKSIRDPLINALDSYKPNSIAINYSKNDSHSDGLSYGMYQVLIQYLQGTNYLDQLFSAEKLISALRGRKTIQEIQRIKSAIETTEDIYSQIFQEIKTGMTEKEVGLLMHQKVKELGLETAWESASCPAVNSGPNSPVGHASPGDIIIQPGHLVHFDFGVKQDDYCSDIQRMAYVLKPDETLPPDPVIRGFNTVVKAIESAVLAAKPGMRGFEIDAIARNVIVGSGYPEYMYATGHHLGRTVHDGAGILGPFWERYGDTPNYILEEGHVYTVEPGLCVPDFGYIGLEEDIVITNNGADYLSNPQKELILIQY